MISFHFGSLHCVWGGVQHFLSHKTNANSILHSNDNSKLPLHLSEFLGGDGMATPDWKLLDIKGPSYFLLLRFSKMNFFPLWIILSSQCQLCHSSEWKAYSGKLWAQKVYSYLDPCETGKMSLIVGEMPGQMATHLCYFHLHLSGCDALFGIPRRVWG